MRFYTVNSFFKIVFKYPRSSVEGTLIDSIMSIYKALHTDGKARYVELGGGGEFLNHVNGK